MTPQLEKIARALHADFNASGRGDYTYEWDDPLASNAYFIAQARAALSALLPPSEEMVRAMRHKISAAEGWNQPLADCFTAAITSILSEGEGMP